MADEISPIVSGISPQNQRKIVDDLSHFTLTHTLRSGVPFSLEDRWMFAGITRVGKTTAARELIRKYIQSFEGLRVVIFDPKDRGDYNGLKSVAKVTHIRSAIAPDMPHLPGVFIWHPKRAEWDEFNTWFSRINDDENPLLVVVDEASRLAKTMYGTSYPKEFVVLNKEGGGMFHALITLVQEIAGGARQIAGQATHTVQFKMQTGYDNRILSNRFERARNAGNITTKEPKHWRGFYHARVDMLDKAREFASYRSFI